MSPLFSTPNESFPSLLWQFSVCQAIFENELSPNKFISSISKQMFIKRVLSELSLVFFPNSLRPSGSQPKVPTSRSWAGSIFSAWCRRIQAHAHQTYLYLYILYMCIYINLKCVLCIYNIFKKFKIESRPCQGCMSSCVHTCQLILLLGIPPGFIFWKQKMIVCLSQRIQQVFLNP